MGKLYNGGGRLSTGESLPGFLQIVHPKPEKRAIIIGDKEKKGQRPIEGGCAMAVSVLVVEDDKNIAELLELKQPWIIGLEVKGKLRL